MVFWKKYLKRLMLLYFIHKISLLGSLPRIKKPCSMHLHSTYLCEQTLTVIVVSLYCICFLKGFYALNLFCSFPKIWLLPKILTNQTPCTWSVALYCFLKPVPFIFVLFWNIKNLCRCNSSKETKNDFKKIENIIQN